jgi:hypothetical protein
MRSLIKKRGALGSDTENAPLVLPVEDAEAPQTTSSPNDWQKKNSKQQLKSLTWIDPRYCPLFAWLMTD